MPVLIGVHRADQLKSLRVNSIYGRRRKFSLDLFTEIEQRGDKKIKGAFWESIVDGTGVFKRTYSGRFPQFDNQILGFIKEANFETPLRILDVAVSDGSTSVEFFNGITDNIASSFEFTATDRDTGFLVLSSKERPDRRVIVSQNGEIVQVVWPPFVFNSARRDNRLSFPINWVIWPVALRYARELVAQWQKNDSRLTATSLIFASQGFRDLLAKDNRLAFKAWDITTSWTGGKVHCVRAMNILNKGYFSPEKLELAVRNLTANLIDGGILAAGSNEGPGSGVDGAIYRMQGGRLKELYSSGNGPRYRPAIEPLLAPR